MDAVELVELAGARGDRGGARELRSDVEFERERGGVRDLKFMGNIRRNLFWDKSGLFFMNRC